MGIEEPAGPQMRNVNPFFKAKPEHIKTLLILTLLLLCIVFSPALKWVISAVLHSNVVHSDTIQAVIPRSWLSELDELAVQAWTPCMSVFCSSPRSSMKIQVEETLVGKEDAWLRRAEIALRERRFSSPARRTLNSADGRVQCLESTSESRPGVIDSACFATESGTVATFEGAVSDLEDFYSVVASAKAVKKR